jgi:hypothetical protein
LDFLPKENLFPFNSSSIKQSLEIFGVLEVTIPYFTNWDQYE